MLPVTGLGFSQSGPPPWQTTLAVPSAEGSLPSPQRLLSPSIPISPLLSSSCLPTLDLPSCLCVPAFLPLPSISLHPPPSVLLPAGSKWKTSVPWSFATVPFIIFSLRHPDLTPHPELVPVFLSEPSPIPPPGWGMNPLSMGYLHTLLAGRALPWGLLLSRGAG